MMADADIDLEADGYHPTRERSTASKKLPSKDLVGVRGLAGAFRTPRQVQSAPAPHKPDQTLAEFLDRVACTVLFKDTPYGQSFIAVCCASGVWVGRWPLPRDDLRLVLPLSRITQCMVLEDAGIFLVLANSTLLAYKIETLLPSYTSEEPRTYHKLAEGMPVHLFAAGTLEGRTLVIYERPSHIYPYRADRNVVVVLEPVMATSNDEPGPSTTGLLRLGLKAQPPSWFRSLHEFETCAEARAIVFLRDQAAVLMSKGPCRVASVKVTKADSEVSVDYFLRAGVINGRPERNMSYFWPMGTFRSAPNEFLACYSEVGLWVNVFGHSTRHAPIVRWNGTAESVEYHQPYLVLFATGFTEVRRVDNGDLVHIIHSPGLYIRNSWDIDSLQATLSGISSPTQDEWDIKAWESQLAGHPPGAGSPEPTSPGIRTDPDELLPVNGNPLDTRFVDKRLSLLVHQTESLCSSHEDGLSYDLLQSLETEIIEARRTHKQAAIQAAIDELDRAIILTDPANALCRSAIQHLRSWCKDSGQVPASCILEEDIEFDIRNSFSSSALSDVYQGHYLGIKVAVKVLRLHKDQREAVKACFRKEVVTWRCLRHPNIVQFLGISNVLPVCLISEWMTEGTLLGFLKRNAAEHRVRYIHHILQGLGFMHSMGVIHGDLKGVNVLIDEDRIARLADFGVATVLYNSSAAATVSVGKGGCGTYRWMAPEMLACTVDDSKSVSPSVRSDIYALAITLWELFSLDTPFPHLRKDFVMIVRVLQGDRPHRPEACEDVGLNAALWDVMQLGWDGDPDQRPALTSFAAALKE